MSQMGVFGFGGGGGSPVLTLTGDVGGPVSPNAGNIDVVGTAGLISTTGNPGASTITWDLDGSVPNSFPTDGGTVTPAAHVLNIRGNTGIETAGVGSTVFISITDDIAQQYDCDAGSAVPAAKILNVIGGDGITTSGAGDTITISADNAGFVWTVVTTNQTAADNNGYFTNDAGAVSVMLPAVSSVGDTFQVVAMSAGGWVVTQGNGQQIRIGNQTTTVGVGGSISSNLQGDWITLVCNVANTNWIAKADQGNFNIV
jgi:hypothetical protein